MSTTPLDMSTFQPFAYANGSTPTPAPVNSASGNSTSGGLDMSTFTPLVASESQSSTNLDMGTYQPLQAADEQAPDNRPWYEKSWDWLNKPLYDFHKWGTRQGAGPIESGVEQGAEDILSGLSSPLSVALTVGTLGTG